MTQNMMPPVTRHTAASLIMAGMRADTQAARTAEAPVGAATSVGVRPTDYSGAPGAKTCTMRGMAGPSTTTKMDGRIRNAIGKSILMGAC